MQNCHVNLCSLVLFHSGLFNSRKDFGFHHFLLGSIPESCKLHCPEVFHISGKFSIFHRKHIFFSNQAGWTAPMLSHSQHQLQQTNYSQPLLKWCHFLMKTPLHFLWMVVLQDVVNKFSLFLMFATTRQWLCLSSPRHCQHLHFKHLHIFQSKQVSNHFSSLCLLYHFWYRSTKASVNYFSSVSEQGGPNLLPTVPSTFFPSHNCTGTAVLVSVFLSYFYQLPFSYMNPITSFCPVFLIFRAAGTSAL